jgi:hypothetical protein
MLTRLVLSLAVCGWAAAPSPARPAEQAPAKEPTLVVRLRSIDDLLANVKYVASLTGREKEAKQIDQKIHAALPKGFEGIDAKRPLGLYAQLDPDGNLQESIPVALVPVSDEKAFLGLIERVAHVTPKLESDGIYSMTPENSPVSVYMRIAHQYAYITAKEKSALSKEMLPTAVFASEHLPLVSATFRLDQIPEALKQLGMAQIEVRLSDVDDQKPAGETAAQHAVKVQAAKQTSAAVSSILKEGGPVTIQVDISPESKQLVLEASFAAQPNTGLAKHLAALGASQSLFASLPTPDAALSAIVHAALPESLRASIGPAIDEGIKNGLEKEKNAAKRAQGEKVLKALSPTLKAGELDVGFALRGPTESKHYTLVAGLKVKDGAQIERVLRDFVKDLPEAERGKIQLDAESAGDIKIHRISGKDLDAEARRNFGDNPFYLAIKSGAVLVSGGDGGLEALKTALSAQPGAAPEVDIKVSLARLAPTTAKSKNDTTAAAQKAFGGIGHGNDQLQITLEGGKSLKARLSMNADVLRFFSILDKEKKGGSSH